MDLEVDEIPANNEMPNENEIQMNDDDDDDGINIRMDSEEKNSDRDSLSNWESLVGPSGNNTNEIPEDFDFGADFGSTSYLGDENNDNSKVRSSNLPGVILYFFRDYLLTLIPI